MADDTKNHKRPRRNEPRPLFPPYIHDYNTLEIKRLMERPIQPAFKVDDGACSICYSKDHMYANCPCEREIPSHIKYIAPDFDRVCIGCGKIGLECCSKGSYAARKRCSFCLEFGHWYWEEKCPEGIPFDVYKSYLWRSFKDGKPLIMERPIILPTFKDTDEFTRLMKRKISKPVADGCCHLCYGEGHPNYECNFLCSIPDGAVVGPLYDVVCAGCGRIGKDCCGVGLYATNKWCKSCFYNGHWHWENNHIQPRGHLFARKLRQSLEGRMVDGMKDLNLTT